MTDILPGTQGVVKRHKRAILLVKLCDGWNHSLLPRVVRVRTGILLCCRYSTEHCRGLIYIFSRHKLLFSYFPSILLVVKTKWGNWWWPHSPTDKNFCIWDLNPSPPNSKDRVTFTNDWVGGGQFCWNQFLIQLQCYGDWFWEGPEVIFFPIMDVIEQHLYIAQESCSQYSLDTHCPVGEPPAMLAVEHVRCGWSILRCV